MNKIVQKLKEGQMKILDKLKRGKKKRQLKNNIKSNV